MSRLGRLLKPETRDRQELRLALAPAEALEACRGAIESLGWSVRTASPDGRRLTTLEDFTKLHCGDSPIRMEIELVPETDGPGTTVNVDAVVPGVGGVSSKHLHEGTLVFAVTLGRRAKSMEEAAPRPTE